MCSNIQYSSWFRKNLFKCYVLHQIGIKKLLILIMIIRILSYMNRAWSYNCIICGNRLIFRWVTVTRADSQVVFFLSLCNTICRGVLCCKWYSHDSSLVVRLMPPIKGCGIESRRDNILWYHNGRLLGMMADEMFTTKRNRFKDLVPGCGQAQETSGLQQRLRL